MTEEAFILSTTTEPAGRVEFHGIPFWVSRVDGLVQAFPYTDAHPDDWPQRGVPVGAACRAVFFLGMTTRQPECSEWWGLSERYYYQGRRLFIGDRLGTIALIYADRTAEFLPVLFGVNAWPYELFTPLQEHEKGKLNNYWGPYPEPFASDPAARKLLDESLVLMENDAEKGLKYIFGVKVKEKPLACANFLKAEYKEAGFAVSAVTALKAGASLDPAWRLVEPDFFLKKAYYPAMDRLARRLYQFSDELPASDPPVPPYGYRGPRVKFSGNGLAEIFANIYTYNLHDITTGKLDETGKSHTSSPEAPSFGTYVGLGTYRQKTGAYYAHMWSRDVGRELVELLFAGERQRTRLAGDVQLKYLYDGCIRYHQPHWKRIANASEMNNEGLMRSLAGKENDGHAAIMLFLYQLHRQGVVDAGWLLEHGRALHEAAGWYAWQIDHPEESNFDRVLYSESEASTQTYGGYDLFSNAQACYALRAFERLAQAMGDQELLATSRGCADKLWTGILERFTGQHPRWGRIFTDTTDDCWTWEYKRFAPLFLLPDLYSYDPPAFDPALDELARNTYRAQKEEFFAFASGRQMGYGQGYLTEAALLLDEVADYTGCVEAAAGMCYHHSDYNYLVPEGVIVHPSGRFWFRNSDLGNAVQQGEIVKCARLLIGLDDLTPGAGLRVIPRLPDGWSSIEVEGYPVVVGEHSLPVSMTYRRERSGFRLELRAPQAIQVASIRFGPFEAGATSFAVEPVVSLERIERAGRVYVYVVPEGKGEELRLGVKVI